MPKEFFNSHSLYRKLRSWVYRFGVSCVIACYRQEQNHAVALDATDMMQSTTFFICGANDGLDRLCARQT